MKHIEIIDNNLMNEVSEQAKASPRLRMNYNFHQSLDDKCHRFLNAVEPGADIPIHRHPDKDASYRKKLTFKYLFVFQLNYPISYLWTRMLL